MVTTEGLGSCNDEAVLDLERIEWMLVFVVLIECNDVDDGEVIRGTGTLVEGGGGARLCTEALEYLRTSEVLRGNGWVRIGDEFDLCVDEEGETERLLCEDWERVALGK